jgi:hypothetical protein
MNKDLIVLFASGGLWSAQASAQGAPVSNAPDATAAPSTVAFIPPESFAFKLNRYGDHYVGLTAQSRIAFSQVKVNAGNITAKVAGESGGSCIHTGQTFTGTIDDETRTIKGSAPGARGPRCQLDVILTFTADGKLVSGTPVTAGDRGRATVDAGKPDRSARNHYSWLRQPRHNKRRLIILGLQEYRSKRKSCGRLAFSC